MKSNLKSIDNRTFTIRIMLTETERNILEHRAEELAGGNMSEYIRRVVFAAKAKEIAEVNA